MPTIPVSQIPNTPQVGGVSLLSAPQGVAGGLAAARFPSNAQLTDLASSFSAPTSPGLSDAENLDTFRGNMQTGRALQNVGNLLGSFANRVAESRNQAQIAEFQMRSRDAAAEVERAYLEDPSGDKARRLLEDRSAEISSDFGSLPSAVKSRVTVDHKDQMQRASIRLESSILKGQIAQDQATVIQRAEQAFHEGNTEESRAILDQAGQINPSIAAKVDDLMEGFAVDKTSNEILDLAMKDGPAVDRLLDEVGEGGSFTHWAGLPLDKRNSIRASIGVIENRQRQQTYDRLVTAYVKSGDPADLPDPTEASALFSNGQLTLSQYQGIRKITEDGTPPDPQVGSVILDRTLGMIDGLDLDDPDAVAAAHDEVSSIIGGVTGGQFKVATEALSDKLKDSESDLVRGARSIINGKWDAGVFNDGDEAAEGGSAAWAKQTDRKMAIQAAVVDWAKKNPDASLRDAEIVISQQLRGDIARGFSTGRAPTSSQLSSALPSWMGGDKRQVAEAALPSASIPNVSRGLVRMATQTALMETGKGNLSEASLNISTDTGGSRSYGIFGFNSLAGNSAHQFKEKYGEGLGLTATPGTAAFDAQWRSAAQTKPAELIKAQISHYNETIIPRVRELAPPEIAGDPRVQAFIADSIVQYGGFSDKHFQAAAEAYKKSHLKGSSKGGTWFINYAANLQEGNLSNDFKTYLSNNPGNLQGLKNRVAKRRAHALTTSPGDISVGQTIKMPMRGTFTGRTKHDFARVSPTGPSNANSWEDYIAGRSDYVSITGPATFGAGSQFMNPAFPGVVFQLDSFGMEDRFDIPFDSPNRALEKGFNQGNSTFQKIDADTAQVISSLRRVIDTRGKTLSQVMQEYFSLGLNSGKSPKRQSMELEALSLMASESEFAF